MNGERNASRLLLISFSFNLSHFVRCKHSHEEHSPNRPFSCFACHNCFDFHSDFAYALLAFFANSFVHSCISCDQAWEDHDVLYETEDERKWAKKPISKTKVE